MIFSDGVGREMRDKMDSLGEVEKDIILRHTRWVRNR